MKEKLSKCLIEENNAIKKNIDDTCGDIITDLDDENIIVRKEFKVV